MRAVYAYCSHHSTGAVTGGFCLLSHSCNAVERTAFVEVTESEFKS